MKNKSKTEIKIEGGQTVDNIQHSPWDNEWTSLVKTLVDKEKDKTNGKILRIRELTLNGRTYSFSEKQSEFISNFDSQNSKFILASGGRGSGKSLALCVKIYLTCKGFPGIRVLLGRKNISDIEKTTLLDLFKLMPPEDYEYRVKDGLLNFRNGSQVVMMGLDAMQSGNMGEIKKAQQKTKSMNIGSYFIDQLEEIEYDVFQAINDTMRMTVSKEELARGVKDYPRQGNMTCNPANFWAYHYFKLNERMDEDGNWVDKKRIDTLLLESSMLDNRANLPEDFVRDRLSRDDNYIRRMVYGEWNTDILTRGSVFAKEYIHYLAQSTKKPLAIEEECEIYEQPRDTEYRMGVDPSEGLVDPSSVSVVDSAGRKVAKFNGKLPIIGLADKVKYLYYKYKKPLIIPESNAAGAALIREIRDLRVWRSKRTEYKTDIETERLGFRMTYDSKQQLITHFQSLLREKKIKIYDQKTIEELKVFVWSNEAAQSGAGASSGFHDDDVISTMLAYWDFNPEKQEEVAIARARPSKVRRFQYI
ncbi:hypothetical protein GW915_00685 [bacterium]|nr:hypothetical protein [bacterium]